jgi:hypothetical protein
MCGFALGWVGKQRRRGSTQALACPGSAVHTGSDGLWDNAFESEIISTAPRDPEDVQRAADSIAVLARQHAADGDFPSPYTREALSQG